MVWDGVKLHPNPGQINLPRKARSGERLEVCQHFNDNFRRLGLRPEYYRDILCIMTLVQRLGSDFPFRASSDSECRSTSSRRSRHTKHESGVKALQEQRSALRVLVYDHHKAYCGPDGVKWDRDRVFWAEDISVHRTVVELSVGSHRRLAITIALPHSKVRGISLSFQPSASLISSYIQSTRSPGPPSLRLLFCGCFLSHSWNALAVRT
jgi:hypothetical protein